MSSLAGLVSKRTFSAIAFAPDEGAASAPSDFARRQLEKFGWKEGRGLGKDGTGNAAFITVQRKDDNLGLGAKTAADVLRQTIERRGLPSDSDSDSEDDESEDADMKVFRACGGIRLGMRARAPQNGKLARLAAADAAFAASIAKPPKADPAPVAIAVPPAAPAAGAEKRKREPAAVGGDGMAAAAAAKAAGKAERKAARKSARKAAKKAAKATQ